MIVVLSDKETIIDRESDREQIYRPKHIPSMSKSGNSVPCIPAPLRVARCLVFNRTVWYFDSVSGIKVIAIPDNACVISQYFVPLTLPVSGILERAIWQP